MEHGTCHTFYFVCRYSPKKQNNILGNPKSSIHHRRLGNGRHVCTATFPINHTFLIFPGRVFMHHSPFHWGLLRWKISSTIFCPPGPYYCYSCPWHLSKTNPAPKLNNPSAVPKGKGIKKLPPARMSIDGSNRGERHHHVSSNLLFRRLLPTHINRRERRGGGVCKMHDGHSIFGFGSVPVRDLRIDFLGLTRIPGVS